MSTIPSGLPTAAPLDRAAGRHRSSGRRATRGRSVRRTLLACVAAGAALASTVAFDDRADARNPMYFGTTSGGYQQMTASTDEAMAVHSYGTFSGGVPQGRMITVRASGTWRQVASTAPGSALHADIVRWAREIKSRGSRVMLAYHHEPETGQSTKYGSAADFIAAYRKVVTIFRQQGVSNVEWTWQMTAWAFRAPSSDRRSAAKWYPGDAYVDNVGGDAYAWGSCGEGNGRWLELSAVAGPVLTFARAHGKAASLPEFGAHRDGRREQWIRNAHRWFVANQDVLAAAFYFNRPPTNGANSDCRWTLATSGEHDAFGDIARDARFTS